MFSPRYRLRTPNRTWSRNSVGGGHRLPRRGLAAGGKRIPAGRFTAGLYRWGYFVSLSAISTFLESASYTFHNAYVNRGSNPCRGAKTSVSNCGPHFVDSIGWLQNGSRIPNISQMLQVRRLSAARSPARRRTAGSGTRRRCGRRILRFLQLTGRVC